MYYYDEKIFDIIIIFSIIYSACIIIFTTNSFIEFENLKKENWKLANINNNNKIII